MRIYRFSPPELEITLIEGGSLLENTTYYIFGQFQSYVGGSIYQGVNSWRSDIMQFTTDSNKRSIQVHWKYSGVITNYVDNYDGTITVICQSPHPFVQDGDVVQLFGMYAGSYAITRVDYYSFIINASYVGTEQSHWEAHDFPKGYTLGSIKFWMHTSLQLNGSGFLIPTPNPYINRYTSHRSYGKGYTYNDILIDTPFSLLIRPNAMQFSLIYYDESFERLQETGSMAIVGDETTFQPLEIYKEMKAAGILYYCSANDSQISFIGSIEFYSATNILENFNISIFSGHLKIPNMTLKNSNIQITNPVSRQNISFKSVNTITTSNINTSFDKLPIVETTTEIVKASPNFNFGYGNEIFGAILASPVSFSLAAMNYLTPGSSMNNATFLRLAAYLVYIGSGDTGGFFLKNIKFANKNASNYDILTYTNIDNFSQRHLNIDTDRPDNVKLCKQNSQHSQGIVHKFYRSGVLTIVDILNRPIEGADVSIQSGQEIVSYSSDSGGIVTFEILEQKTPIAYNIITGEPIYNIKIEVSKIGYQSTISFARIGKFLDGMEITMLENVPPIYIDQNIKGEVTTIEIEGKVESLINIKGEILCK